MGSNYKINYNVDVVFCIDVTQSMGNVLEKAQNTVINFYSECEKDMEARGRHADDFRVRIIAFRDYLFDDRNAMLVSEFFRLPQDADKLKKCVSSLVAQGGGDEPEDGLEALAYAIRSKWNNTGRKRHVIILMTDDDTHNLGFGKQSAYYPKGMAVDMDELTSWWGDANEPGHMDQSAKRLILVAPDTPNWRQVSDNWDNVGHIPFMAGNDFGDLTFRLILMAIFGL